MKRKIFFSTVVLSLILAFPSCIKDEPLYMEAYIEEVTFADSVHVNANFRNGRYEITVVENTDLTNLAPQIKISPNATISPESGTPQDFTDGVIYTVTSEDKRVTKKYMIRVSHAFLNLKFDFEDWTEEVMGITQWPVMQDIMWSSANKGIATAKLGQVDEYPTRYTEDSHSGKYAALLETLKGGTFIAVGKVPIFSGSLFWGNFELNMTSPPKSALFGQAFPKGNSKPIKFTGYYKYTSGKEFITKAGAIPGRIDEFDVYSVLYKVSKGEAGNKEYLNGENIHTSDKVIARATVTDRIQKDSYTKFSVPFEYTEEMDYTKYNYKLAIVFASSRRGDFYEGSIGSRLLIDDVEVICEE